MSTIKIIKCLIASPSDVSQERDICETVFEEINRELGSVLNFRIESVRWEKDAHAGCGEYGQEVINRQFDGLYDLFLGIMYSRFGTPTPVAGSGTEEEFDIAYSKKNEGKVDDILFYFNSAPIPQAILDPDQYKKVCKFKERLEKLQIFYKSYNGTDAFGGFLRQELTVYFRQRFGKKKRNEKGVDKLSKNLVLPNEPIVNYRIAWKETIDLLYRGGKLDEVVKKIEKLKKKIHFVKTVYLQDNVIDQIIRKEQLDKNEAILISWAIDECGLNPHYYFNHIKDYEELNKLPLWNLLIEKEGTFNGKEDQLSGTNDNLVYENIQRNLFHFNFEEANRIINDWNPSGYFIVSKAMRLATQKGQEDNALKMLADYISRETNLSTKLYAMQIANYISCRYPWPYDTEVLYQYGIDGIGDMLNYMVQQLRGKVEAPRTRGWIGSTMKWGGSHPEYENSLRILRFISDCGIYPSLGGIIFFDAANWYLVFQNLYEEFPYPCFFYSILYRDNNLLTRVGQDFAYSTKLSDFNEDIIVKSLKAINDINTPQCFHEGLVRIICPIYMAVEEKVWYQLFKTHIFTSFIEQISKYDSNSSIVRNIEYALLALKDSEHVNEVLLDILTHYRENTQLAYSLICYHLHLKIVKDSIQDSITSVLENLVSTCQLTEIIELFAYLNNEAFLPDEIKKQFIAKLISTHIESIPQKATAFNLCMLVKDDPSALSLAKQMLLKNDIWHCGVMENGEGWIAPNNIRLNLFKKEIAWTDEEFQLIKENLISNIEKYDKHHVSLHNDSFMRHVHIEYLSDVLQFIENLNEERRLSLDDIYMKVGALLKNRLEHNNFIEGMLSHQSSDVDYAMRNVIKGIEAKGVKAYLDEFNYILDYVLSGGNCAVNRALKYIKVVVEKHSKDIIDNRMCSKLYMIISLYKERWESIKEFSPVWSFNYLNSIALFLKNNGYADSESVKYWLHDSFVNKFIR